ncbi:malto-oligosyltrehalose synthase [Xanthobacter sp. KR7-65]|uniref:malto-oligosyltrehalose synthase n=1 Tax=Xanthobacter sp. KR7-65 TaxID=3156612 RepID=UPI0032B49058
MTFAPSAPRATYRLQLHAGFTFDDAAAIVPYLADLGVSHLYASPILTARRGSTHGYDVVDPEHVNPELGGEDRLGRLVEKLRAHGLGMVVDIVPNHMGVGGDENRWWLDVLRRGPASPFAATFDIDWDAGGGKLLAPFLGGPYAEILAGGDLKLVREDEAGWAVRYFHHLFPLRPQDSDALDADPASAPATPTALHALLERQHYRLAFWRTAPDAINWRRFFDVTELAALRADAPGVFERTHAKVLELYARGLVDGLRVDHVDGLADPGAYCRRLRAELDARRELRPAGLGGRAWLVVEKILASGEPLESTWAVDGTTGYDFMEATSRLLHDAAGRARLADDWAARTGRPADFAAEEHAARKETLARAFTAPLEALTDNLTALASRSLADRDRPRAALRRCLVEILAHMPRYRTYAAGADAPGAEALDAAITAARRSGLPGDAPHLERIADWLGRPPADAPDAALRRRAIVQFEQLSSPVAAKSVEDTAFYRFGPLLSRNDVGFDAAIGGGTVAEWHAGCTARARNWPAAMLASATHDHKRGEDVRARLCVLSECPELWLRHLDGWLAGLDPIASEVSPADRIMLLQTLVGAWPPEGSDLAAFRERVADWQTKALREAKLASSWDAPNEAYEAAAHALTDAILLAPEGEGLRRQIAAFVATIEPAAEEKGLVQTVLKLTAPGVPDIYQGTEYRDFSLVDPDNRRPVDFAARAGTLASAPLDADGRKQCLIHALLSHRAEAPDLYASGTYAPLDLIGAEGETVIAYMRATPSRALAVAARRLTFDARGTQAAGWGGARLDLPPGFTWRALLCDGAGVPAHPAVGEHAGDWPLMLLAGTRIKPGSVD